MSRSNYDHLIDKEHPSSLCPLCDNMIGAEETTEIVEAHGAQWLVHRLCLIMEDTPESGPLGYDHLADGA